MLSPIYVNCLTRVLVQKQYAWVGRDSESAKNRKVNIIVFAEET